MGAATVADTEAISKRILAHLWNPHAMCVYMVAVLPLLSACAALSVFWPPLGYVGVPAAAVAFPRVHRSVQRELDRDRTWRGTNRVGAVAALLSIPVAQVFFRSDLGVMAAPFVAAAKAGVPELARAIPGAIYGAAPGWPSYSACQSLQGWVGADAAGFCYAGAGYVRMWQILDAVPMLASLTTLYIVLPLTVMWFSPNRIR